MRTEISKPYDILYIGVGLSSILHFLKQADAYANKTVCFVEYQNQVNLNKTISGFSKKIDLPIIKKFNKFECHFGDEVKIYDTRSPYQILDLEKIYEEFVSKSKGCDIFYNTDVKRVVKNKLFKVYSENKIIFAKNVHDSRLPKINNQNYLKQHFHGWFLKFSKGHGIKNPIIMDIDQVSKNLCFCYILPFSVDELLVEITFYSKDILSIHEYEKKLSNYLDRKFENQTYTVTKKESGVIPLISFQTQSIINGYQCLGIRNGNLRASTGYSVFSSYLDMHQSKLLKILDQFLLKVLWISPHLGSRIFTHFLKRIDGDTLADFMGPCPKIRSIAKAAFSMPLLIFIRHLFKSKNQLTTKQIVRGPNE